MWKVGASLHVSRTRCGGEELLVEFLGRTLVNLQVGEMVLIKTALDALVSLVTYTHGALLLPG